MRTSTIYRGPKIVLASALLVWCALVHAESPTSAQSAMWLNSSTTIAENGSQLDFSSNLNANDINTSPRKYGLDQGAAPFKGWGVYTEELDGSEQDAADIANLGVSYVIYFYRGGTNSTRVENTLKDFENLASHGVSVALWVTDEVSPNWRRAWASQFASVSNLIAWYVFDEPVRKKVSIPDQNTAIATMRAIKDIPCAVAENIRSFPKLELSNQYDFIFVDNYHGKNAVFYDLDRLNVFGSVQSFQPLVGLSHLIPVYGAFANAQQPLLAPNDLFRTFWNQLEMFGPGALFIYKASKTGGSLTTISQDRNLQSVVMRLVHTTSPQRQFVTVNAALVDENAGYTLEKAKAAWQKIVAAKSTARLAFDGSDRHRRNGVLLTSGQYLMIDFGRRMRSIRIYGRFFNDNSPPGASTEFTFIASDQDSSPSGKIFAKQTVKTSGNSTAEFTDMAQGINCQYVFIVPSSGTWNDATGFDALGYSAIPL